MVSGNNNYAVVYTLNTHTHTHAHTHTHTHTLSHLSVCPPIQAWNSLQWLKVFVTLLSNCLYNKTANCWYEVRNATVHISQVICEI